MKKRSISLIFNTPDQRFGIVIYFFIQMA